MTRQNFDRELQRLQDELMALGSMVEEALVRSVQQLKQRDFQASHRLIAADKGVNERRFAMEEDVMTLIATQQPMAGDMRLLAAILEMVTELERIGDYAKGIARINLLIGEQPLIKPLIDLPAMAEKAACNSAFDEAAKKFSCAVAQSLIRLIAVEDDRRKPIE